MPRRKHADIVRARNLHKHLKTGPSNSSTHPTPKITVLRLRKKVATERQARAADTGGKPQESSSKAETSSSRAGSSEPDLFSISLSGDEDGTVPLYESCDEIRQKIKDHLQSTKTTKASFLRDIARAAFPHSDPPIKIQSKQLADFLSLEGATSGNANRVYYASYVYFEKKRLSEGGEKSEHRLRMEKEWKLQGGISRKQNGYVWSWAPKDCVVFEDDLGKTHRERW
ncbi:hypothetical protein AAF712_000048 [Marasmius tenuissimus]|uniref:DUF7726 domain-containing protein n=1 Tax=Marasmius tenuissimus TaxID=585030 RepID=A0ABR3AFX5_9AGAR